MAFPPLTLPPPTLGRCPLDEKSEPTMANPPQPASVENESNAKPATSR